MHGIYGHRTKNGLGKGDTPCPTEETPFPTSEPTINLIDYIGEVSIGDSSREEWEAQVFTNSEGMLEIHNTLKLCDFSPGDIPGR